MNAIRMAFMAAVSMGVASIAMAAEPPAITGKPKLDTPTLLLWPSDRGELEPNLNDPTSNVLFDFHGEVNRCDFAFSTEGNYHPALHDIWPKFLAKFAARPLQNPFYSTSPAVFTEQIKNGVLQFGNLYARCRPQVAVGSREEIEKLQDARLADGEPMPLYEDRGEVILVKKGNPKGIKTIWDLARPDVRYVSPNPEQEQGAFKSYLKTLHGIASHDPKPPAGMNADKLIDAVFNNKSKPDKWLAGARIHHRDVPWSLAYGQADAGIIIYHLARYTQQTFPEQFDIVPLGGSVADPQPLPGTHVGTRFLIRVKGEWTARQREATKVFVDTLLSNEFTAILEERGLRRPQAMKATQN